MIGQKEKKKTLEAERETNMLDTESNPKGKLMGQNDRFDLLK